MIFPLTLQIVIIARMLSYGKGPRAVELSDIVSVTP